MDQTRPSRRTALYPPGEPTAKGLLELDRRHRMYWEVSGNPNGAPVRVSLAGETLQFADPIWVSRLHAGASWSCYSLGIGMTLTTVAIAIVWVFGESYNVLLLPAMGVTLLSLFLGGWLLSSSNPSMVSDEKWYSARRIVRYTIVGGVVSGSTGIFLYAIDPGGALWRWLVLLGAPFGLTGLIGACAFCRYCAWMARKVGDDFSEKQSRLYLRGYITSWLLFGPGLVMLLHFSNPDCWYFLVPGVIGVFVFGILILFLPSYFDGIEKNLKLAREIWSEAEDKADASP